MTSIAACIIPEDKGHLKAELQNLRRKGALKPSLDWDNSAPNSDRTCGRCRVELGRVINRGAYCRACRLKVCKGCREYSFRTTDWVCTVCHKHMEIQAASGEWINEFVRKPSRRRDNRVYVPAADIIKRTIRRSWTISNPTPRWSALRGSPELRPYNSLPRGQDVNNYPSLALHQTNIKNRQNSIETSSSPPSRHRSPARRTLSEDVYTDRASSPTQHVVVSPQRQRLQRVSPLMQLARERKKSPNRWRSSEGSSEEGSSREDDRLKSRDTVTPERTKTFDNVIEKRVSFDNNIANTSMLKEKLLNSLRNHSVREGKTPEHRSCRLHSHQGDQSDNSEESSFTSNELHYAREEAAPLELCDIEPISGTVFRKVTVRRRRQESARKISPVDTGWRRGQEQDLLDILLPDGDDYKLVFINSDSSSKEEISSKEEDDNDSSSTASSFPIDECDWDYFDPGSGRPSAVINWSSPFGSPSLYSKGALESPIGSPLVYRRRVRESDTGTDDDTTRLDSGSPASSDSLFQARVAEDTFDHHRNDRIAEDSAALQCLHAEDIPQRQPCHNCGAPTQYIPIPVPVPIPFPVPTFWTPQDTRIFYGEHNAAVSSRLRVLPRNLWPYLTPAALIWPPISAGELASSQPVLHNNISDCGVNTGATMPVATDRDDRLASAGANDAEPVAEDTNRENDASEDDKPPIIEKELTGYLECENRFVSSSDESENSSDSSDTSENSKPRVRRVYNVNGGEGRQSDDALPSSNLTSDVDEEDGRLSHSSVREDDMSSSGSADTDSDDTGTVADQKPKRFSRIFVVNRDVSTSSNESSCSSKTDSSDNDTDTEMDCTVILTNVKQLDEDDCSSSVGEGNANKEAARGGSISDNTDKDETRVCDNDTSDKNSEKVDKEPRGNGKESEYMSSSPGLSDVSAESLNSSEVDVANANDAVVIVDEAEETPSFLAEAAKHDDQCSIGEWNEIRSSEAINVEGESRSTRHHEGVSLSSSSSSGELVSGESLARHAARYTSLVMITQEPAPNYQQVSVVTSGTTTLVADNDVIVRHTNWQDEVKRNSQGKLNDNQNQEGESVTVITGGETLSAFEEGLADDDSWVENLSHEEDEDEFATTSPTEDSSSGEEITLTCSAALDQEEDLRGYHRTAIDFTLHTIVEESCEESEVEQNASKKKERTTSATDLEKYFFFGLGDGTTPSINSNREDAFSETSSIYSEGMESLGGDETYQQNDNSDPAELASSRLEKYFLTGFMGFTAERRDSDGSVGSDSEGRPSPEQRRKRLVRARGTGRSHSSSLDNLDNAGNEHVTETQMNSGDSSSSESEVNDEISSFEKSDGQFDTVKRKKCKKPKNTTSPGEEAKNLETTQEVDERGSESDEDGHKTPQPETSPSPSNLSTTKNQQSRDSGFIGSCDDLLKEQRDNNTPELPSSKHELKIDLEDITEGKKIDDKLVLTSTPPATLLTRKDSFNNWSSDEETNLMMSKMRQFFKSMVANSQLTSSSKPLTPTLNSPKPFSSPRNKNRSKPPQLVYFENELTRLMKTVPGIRDDQVREIVEYLSSEDTWSDSYDSSDYTSSDLEVTTSKSVLQQQISDSCKQIINKFDTSVDDEGDEGDGGIVDESHGLNKESAFVYQKLVASFEKIAAGETEDNATLNLAPNGSPPLIAKVMHHIGSRLVALMHEVSSGESHKSISPKTKHYHRRLQHKISSASSTTTEDDCPESSTDNFGGFEDNLTPYNLLPRSRSHDLLVSETRAMNQSSGGVSDTVEEREASDCERFSWRGSFESALLASDSRNKLSLLGGEGSASASALAVAAKRRSAGDLLFSHKSLSREQLDRVRSCGSIGGASSEDKLWVATAIRPNRRRSSVPDASCGSGGSADGEDEDEEMESRSTLPRSLQSGAPTTNSLPRLPTNAPSQLMQKSLSMHHFLPQNVKSARYRPPGFSRLTTIPKRAVSAPGLQPSHQRRGRRSQQPNVPSDEASISEAHSSPMLATRNGNKSATPSPVAPTSRRNLGPSSSQEWQNDEDIDRLVGLHGRTSLSTLGLRSDSMASVYSGAGEGRYGTVTVKGQVEFGLQYNYKAGALEIQIKQCKDLAPVDVKRNRSDPYVKVYLLPDKSKSGKRKTKVKKHTLNPVFDECLKFHIPLSGLESRTLWLTVWHSDMFGRNDFLGEVMMTLENKVFDDPTPIWYNLQERTEPFEDVTSYKGDIIVCLKFIPPDMTVQKKGKRSRGALHVLVKEAKSLAAVKANGTSDPFCKSYLLPEKGRSSKQKTPIARRTTNPVWNYTFVYDDVTLQELAERCLELTVWDHDRLASNEFLGGVRFSLGTGKHYGKTVEWMDASGRELTLWKNMLEKPNFWVEGCLSLRSSLDSRVS